MKALCVPSRPSRKIRHEDRTRKRMERLANETRANERVRDMAVARLVAVLESAHSDGGTHVVGRFRQGDSCSRLARLRAAHATYALATMTDMERPSDGAFVRA